RDAQVEMMQDGVPPNGVEAGVGEWQGMGVGRDELDADVVRGGALPGLGEIIRREIEGGHASALASQDDAGHAMTAAVIRQCPAGRRAEANPGRTDPGFVIEIFAIGEAQPAWLAVESLGPAAGLFVVEVTLTREAIHRGYP